MTDRASTLRQQLIRNFNDAPLKHETREPLYEWSGARLASTSPRPRAMATCMALTRSTP